MLKLANSDGIKIGSFRKVPVYLSLSWFFIAAFLVITFTPTVKVIVPSYSTFQAGIISFIYAILLAVSIFIHEVAHTVVAQKNSLNVSKIVLNIFGGHTQFRPGQATPKILAVIALAGPLANFVIAGISYLATFVFSNITVLLLLQSLYYVNLFVAILNILPAFPLDGGRALESLITAKTKQPKLGLKVTGYLGMVLCVALVIWIFIVPLVSGYQVNMFSALLGLIVVSYLFSAAQSAVRQANGKVQEAVVTLPFKERMEPAIAIPAKMHCHKVKALSTKIKHIAIVKDEFIEQVVNIEALNSIPEDQLKKTLVTSVASPFDKSGILLDVMTKEQMLKRIALIPAREYFIVDSRMSIIGFMTYEQIINMVQNLEEDGV
ncbi:MAG: site-2 protease family protein [Micrococcaceae bacterium]